MDESPLALREGATSQQGTPQGYLRPLHVWHSTGQAIAIAARYSAMVHSTGSEEVPMNIEIHVTQEDIATGEERNCHACPVARAIKREVRRDVIVEVYTLNVAMSGGGWADIELPSIAASFIEQFDHSDALVELLVHPRHSRLGTQMNIEAGKYYRTRDGKKAYVAARIPDEITDGEYLFIGWIRYAEDDWGSETWCDGGRYLCSGNGSSADDLCVEWTDYSTSLIAHLTALIDLHEKLNPRVADDDPRLARQSMQSVYERRQGTLKGMLCDAEAFGDAMYEPTELQDSLTQGESQ
jgi:hypothetical protein